MTAIIETHQLTKCYGSIMALDKINLSINNKTTIGLVGKNGAGKTTLLSLLCGSLQPSSGTIRVLGYSPADTTLNNKLNILLQDTNFKKGISVNTQLRHFAQLQGLSKQKAEREVSVLLKRLDNVEFAEKKPEKLSYGQRKRLAITQAFLGNPELVVLDEPTAGLDPVAANTIRKFIRSYSEKITFIISSHNLYEIEDICSTVVVLDKGKLMANIPMSELFEKYNTLNITLDQKPTDSLTQKISQLIEINEFILDSSNPNKFSLHFTSPRPDEFQQQVQLLINEQGFNIVNLNRGKNLTEEIIELVNA